MYPLAIVALLTLAAMTHAIDSTEGARYRAIVSIRHYASRVAALVSSYRVELRIVPRARGGIATRRLALNLSTGGASITVDQRVIVDTRDPLWWAGIESTIDAMHRRHNAIGASIGVVAIAWILPLAFLG